MAEVLADLLEDNARLHRVYALTAGPGPWAECRRKAAEHIEDLQASSANELTRAACRRVLAALAVAGTSPPGDSGESLAVALREAQAAMAAPTTSSDERATLQLRQEVLRHRLLRSSPPGPGIPRILHWVKTDSTPDDLPLVQYLCYRSMLAHCKGYRVLLHAPAVPRGPRWERLLPHVEVAPGSPPQWLGTQRLVWAAHQSDVWRVKELIRHGGFYFDWDLLLLRSPEALRESVCVMALERHEEGFDEVLGVSAIGAEPGSRFLVSWLDAMPGAFNPRKYVVHSTVLARRLALGSPALVRLLDYRSFYYPGWSDAAMRWLFDPAERLPDDVLQAHLAGSIGMHLFCSHAHFIRWAGSLAEREIEDARCNLAALLRPYL